MPWEDLMLEEAEFVASSLRFSAEEGGKCSQTESEQKRVLLSGISHSFECSAIYY